MGHPYPDSIVIFLGMVCVCAVVGATAWCPVAIVNFMIIVCSPCYPVACPVWESMARGAKVLDPWFTF